MSKDERNNNRIEAATFFKKRLTAQLFECYKTSDSADRTSNNSRLRNIFLNFCFDECDNNLERCSYAVLLVKPCGIEN